MVGVQIILGDSPLFHRFPKLVVLDHAISPPFQIYLTFPYYPHKIRNSIVFVCEHYREGGISLHYLSNGFIDDVYDTLQGSLIPEACIPGVKNMFLPCDDFKKSYLWFCGVDCVIICVSMGHISVSVTGHSDV